MIGFPGLIAPASLKRGSLISPFRRSALFSGVNCPGLIEAMMNAAGLRRRMMFSGVNCPGLIEAVLRMIHLAGGWLVFRG